MPLSLLALLAVILCAGALADTAGPPARAILVGERISRAARATEHVFRRHIRCPDYRARVGPAAAGRSNVSFAPDAMAHMAELCRQLSLHRYCMGQPSPSDALCDGDNAASDGFNFAHLYSVSLLPLSTAWMAESKLAPQPVAFYGAVFFLVNATYIFLIWDLLDHTSDENVPPRERKIMRFRSLATLCCFGAAAVVALWYPLAALGICCGCLVVYLKPDAPGSWTRN
jgi:hypothetical protein